MNEPEEKSEAPPTKQPGTEAKAQGIKSSIGENITEARQILLHTLEIQAASNEPAKELLASALKALDNALQTISEASETKKLTETVETNVMAEEATSEGSIGVEDLNVAVTRPIITFSDSSVPALDVTETVESNVTADMTSNLNVAVTRPIVTFSDSSVPALDVTETVESNVTADMTSSEGSIGVEDFNVAVTRPIITFSDSSVPALDVTETVESNVTADMTSSEGSIGVEDLNVAVTRPIVTFSDSSVPAFDVTETVESNVTADMTSSGGPAFGVEDLNVAVIRPIITFSDSSVPALDATEDFGVKRDSRYDFK
ncbi:hypothetical protein OS493_018574 [Desmophyllum pertusum]|uniref:Uncharacterized protein n=1 Tax=Desmophyllum pertusum TaxID=174260 RepID=A0A9X0A253_9CNID|nr:hypothetical protein OS493_018574 [Desmophyllum pertusum]